MKQKILKSQLGVIAMLCLVCSLSSIGAFARDNDRGDNRGNIRESDQRDNREDNKKDVRQNQKRDDRSNIKAERHFYRNGRWYRRGLFGLSFTVKTLSVGAIIESLPPKHTTVIIDGNSYYYDDQFYYRDYRDGYYVVVEPPRR